MRYDIYKNGIIVKESENSGLINFNFPKEINIREFDKISIPLTRLGI